MNIVELKYEHRDALIDFYNRNKFPYFKPHEFDTNTIHKILINKKRDRYFVVEHNDIIIGYGILRGMDEGYSIPSLGIAIDNEYQSLGLGRLLMGFLEMHCRLTGYNTIRLRVMKENAEAIRFYKDLGYDLSYYDEEHFLGLKRL